MSGSGSDAPAPGPERDEFIEHDHRETQLPFGPGRVPILIAVLWLGFIVAYVVVMAILALPDLRAWLAH